MPEQSDWDLVAQAQAGDRDAFAALVQRYQTPLVHFCARMIGSQQDAEEIAQDAFVRLYKHLNRLTPKAKFSTFLFGIARNLTLNALRDAQRRGRGKHTPLETAYSVGDDRQRPDRAAVASETEARLEEALGRLSPAHREVLLLREREGLEYIEIARICRCRVGTVKSRLARARENLRAEMDRLGGEDP